MTLTFTDHGGEAAITDHFGEHHIAFGAGAWRMGATALDSGETRPVAASGAWTTTDTFTLKLLFYTTPFTPHITLRFEGDKLAYQFVANAAFGRRTRPRLTGRQSSR